MVFGLNSDTIRSGDIILMTDGNRFISWPVRLRAWANALARGQTGGFRFRRWSHALLAASRYKLIEAVPGNGPVAWLRAMTGNPAGQVQAIDVRKFRSDLCVLRLKDAVGGEAAANAAAAQAARFVTGRYNYPGVAAFVVPCFKRAAEGRAFCSELIVRSYETVGINLLPGRPPERVTPAELESSSLLMTSQ
jgi:hypothetical protein